MISIDKLKEILSTSDIGVKLSDLQIQNVERITHNANKIIFKLTTDDDKSFVVKLANKSEATAVRLKYEYDVGMKLNKLEGFKDIYVKTFDLIEQDDFIILIQEFAGDKSLMNISDTTEKLSNITQKVFDALNNLPTESASKSDLTTELEQELANYDSSNNKKYLEQCIETIIESEKSEKRLVNFDLIESNIIFDSKNFKIIDMEFVKESTLTFVEPFRLIYYLLSDLNQNKILDSKGGNLNLVDLVINPNHILHKLVPSAYQSKFSEYLSLFLMVEANMQKNVNADKYDPKFFEDMINLIQNPSKVIFEEIDNLKKQLHELGKEKQDLEKMHLELSKHADWLDKQLNKIQSKRSYKISQKFSRIID